MDLFVALTCEYIILFKTMLLFVLGCFAYRTSPASSLCVEANDRPLYFRRKKLSYIRRFYRLINYSHILSFYAVKKLLTHSRYYWEQWIRLHLIQCLPLPSFHGLQMLFTFWVGLQLPNTHVGYADCSGAHLTACRQGSLGTAPLWNAVTIPIPTL